MIDNIINERQRVGEMLPRTSANPGFAIDAMECSKQRYPHYGTMTRYITLCNALYLAIAHIFRPQNQELLMWPRTRDIYPFQSTCTVAFRKQKNNSYQWVIGTNYFLLWQLSVKFREEKSWLLSVGAVSDVLQLWSTSSQQSFPCKILQRGRI